MGPDGSKSLFERTVSLRLKHGNYGLKYLDLYARQFHK